MNIFRKDKNKDKDKESSLSSSGGTTSNPSSVRGRTQTQTASLPKNFYNATTEQQTADNTRRNSLSAQQEQNKNHQTSIRIGDTR
jgi:hypothetical protein